MYNYDYYNDMTIGSDVTDMLGTIILGVLGTFIFIIFTVLAFTCIYNWILYKKAGRKGWEALIPIYNIVVKFQFLNIPLWMLIFLFIPVGNLAVSVFVAINTSKKFGKDTAFTIGLILLPVVFYPILAFGKAKFNPIIPGIFDQYVECSKYDDEYGYCCHCGSKKTGMYCSFCGKTNEE